MKSTIVGLEKINYEKKDGTEVDAHRFHLSRNDPNVVGQCTEEVYFSTKQLNNLGIALREDDYDGMIGQEVNVEYNNRGFVVALEILD